jgi:hypothetical protein
LTTGNVFWPIEPTPSDLIQSLEQQQFLDSETACDLKDLISFLFPSKVIILFWKAPSGPTPQSDFFTVIQILFSNSLPMNELLIANIHPHHHRGVMNGNLKPFAAIQIILLF